MASKDNGVLDMRGKKGIEIAQLIADGEVTQKVAEKFVAERAVGKLRAAQDKIAA